MVFNLEPPYKTRKTNMNILTNHKLRSNDVSFTLSRIMLFKTLIKEYFLFETRKVTA